MTSTITRYSAHGCRLPPLKGWQPGNLGVASGWQPGNLLATPPRKASNGAGIVVASAATIRQPRGLPTPRKNAPIFDPLATPSTGD